MKLSKLLILPLSLISVAGLAQGEIEVKDNHFRFENLQVISNKVTEEAHLMCFHKKPTSWTQPKQFTSGKQNLWVKARVNNQGGVREAVVNFKVDLSSGKSYMINRKRKNNSISLWIEDVETGDVVSKIVTTNLRQPLLTQEMKERAQCKSSTI